MIGLTVAGFVVGALAELIGPRGQKLDILATIGLGLVGSFAGGLVAQTSGAGSIRELNVTGFIFAVVAAVLLIGVAGWRSGRDGRTARPCPDGAPSTTRNPT